MSCIITLKNPALMRFLHHLFHSSVDLLVTDEFEELAPKKKSSKQKVKSAADSTGNKKPKK